MFSALQVIMWSCKDIFKRLDEFRSWDVIYLITTVSVGLEKITISAHGPKLIFDLVG